MGNYHARCGAAEKPEVVTPEAYLSLFGEIPDFDKMLSTMRKYEISCTIILQSLSQIKAKYDKIWETLVGNCVRPEVASALQIRRRGIYGILPLASSR